MPSSLSETVLVLVLLLLVAVHGLSVVPKLEFSDDSTSIGIKPDHHKEAIAPALKPSEVKAVLEVNLVHSDPKPSTDQVLICTLDDKCKLHVTNGDKKGGEDEDDEKKVYKPVIVSGFDADPEKEVQDAKDQDHDDGKDKKKIPHIPVYVAHRGAAPDVWPLGPEEYPHRRHWGLPVYYGLKLGPEFHQPDNGVFQPVEYAPLHPDHVTGRPPGLVDVGYRYPNPYGRFLPRNGVRTIITPFGRRISQHRVYWSTPSVVAVSGKVDLDLEMTSTSDEVKVEAKLEDLE